MTNYRILQFPDSRIASIDICEMGKQKHHVAGLLTFDVTDSRKKIRDYNKAHSDKISFNAWLINVIGATIKQHETAASYLISRNKQIIFDDINISMIVEKEINGVKVPIPCIVEKANEKSIASIAKQIAEAKNAVITESDMVIQRKTNKMEKMYAILPKFLRIFFWRFLLKHPKKAFQKMGNVAFTSIGMMGKVNGWFIPISIHPLCFGISSIIKKPWVVDDKIEIREILNMSVLLDHDVIDGANMARLISDLSKNIENGLHL